MHWDVSWIHHPLTQTTTKLGTFANNIGIVYYCPFCCGRVASPSKIPRSCSPLLAVTCPLWNVLPLFSHFMRNSCLFLLCLQPTLWPEQASNSISCWPAGKAWCCPERLCTLGSKSFWEHIEHFQDDQRRHFSHFIVLDFHYVESWSTGQGFFLKAPVNTTVSKEAIASVTY